MAIGKRYKAAIASFDRNKAYSIEDAVGVIKKNATAKFDETIEIAIKVNIKKGQTLRDTLVLPNQFSGEKKILVFARGDKAREAEEAGATYVGDVDYVEKVRGGWLDFDAVIATPDMMKDIGRLGPVLGRRGLMPNPKTKTVTMDVAEAVKELQKGRVEIRADKAGVVHVAVGKASMEQSQIKDNIDVVLNEVQTKRPSDAKGDFLESMFASSTMGPGVRIAVA